MNEPNHHKVDASSQNAHYYWPQIVIRHLAQADNQPATLVIATGRIRACRATLWRSHQPLDREHQSDDQTKNGH